MSNTTKRACVPALEAVLGEAVPVLDHGFVRVVDYMGDDAAIVQSARVSYSKGTKSVRDDTGLIRYLMRHHHSTPFEMCEIKLHVKLPMFVARQWIRHRTANVNEISARYSILDREFYIPEPEHIAVQSAQNNQGRGSQLDSKTADIVRDALRNDGDAAFEAYEWLLGDGTRDGEKLDQGIARELARMTLPVNTYTQWYWKIDLQNLLRFLALRSDPHAQYEIRAYADAMLELVKLWVPAAYQAFVDYQQNSFSLSGPMTAYLKDRLAGKAGSAEEYGMSARELRELLGALDLQE